MRAFFSNADGTEVPYGTPGIYELTSPSGRKNIGKSVNCVRGRIIDHWRSAKRGDTGCPKLWSSMRKYSDPSEWSLKVIPCDPNVIDPGILEVIYIALSGSFFTGLNSTHGGEGTAGRVHSLEERKRASERMKGTRLPLATREKIRRAVKNRSKELKDRFSEGRRNYIAGTIGVPRPQEVRNKISASKKGALKSRAEVINHARSLRFLPTDMFVLIHDMREGGATWREVADELGYPRNMLNMTFLRANRSPDPSVREAIARSRA